jgi:hypothetical protein
MSNWELIDHNPQTGLKKYIGDNPDDPEGCLVRYEQSAQAIQQILDRNKAVQNDSWDRKSDMWHAAHIPIGVMYEWKVKHGVDAWNYSSCEDTKRRVNALLNSNEYRYLRVRHFII